MSVPKKLVSGLAAIAVSLAMAVAVSSPAQAAGPKNGCPYGAACIYSGVTAEAIAQGPVAIWWDGVYTLNNVFNQRAIINNQYGGWVIQICYGWYGTNCPPGGAIYEGLAGFPDMTPINSVWLHPGPPVFTW
ncbi:hypothetical protein KZZ52_27030 [Dactylosporangium sp. AC04546]|uniref:hypothetical protein n=1 Tax=Dactylosporangium sp. AC04546 TaxID=2862460 RepID=UPI001EDEB514|nr:hypothetical protein [Dactylosporangium sp. AC04546]WVK88920.1 hypothetical protein KZZ52_27030 [Dactylosporangium sp. AC04546]